MSAGISTGLTTVEALGETERRLRESEEGLRLALWAAHMVCWEWDIPAGEVRVTGSLGTLTGSDGVMSHLAPSQLADVHPDDQASVAAVDRQAMERGASYDLEFRVQAPTGRSAGFPKRGESWRT